MKFSELYSKNLDRTVNPAVSASDLNDATVKVEIEEYVFTKEIINNLYKILSNIKDNQGSHAGIWINGYYGSGKSHFLKYLDYCLSKKYGADALSRLRDAAAVYQPMELDAEIGEFDEVIRWYNNKASVESIIFNIGTIHDANSDQRKVFTEVFWNQFNGMRGFNDTNLALAQHLEKALYDDGKYVEFVEYVSSKGYDWKKDIHRFGGSKLDLALQLAGEIDKKISLDVIRERIKNKDVNISVDSFANELREYIEAKNNENYRLVFFVDEISQFIDGRQSVLLQLQEVVTRVCEACKSQVWFACTAQQDLSEVIQSCNISSTTENYGKIMGRFEVRASLQGTQPEYITRKRILEKNGVAEMELNKCYDQYRTTLESQFALPSTYHAYESKDDFVGYYPFVPYQFQLFMKVLDSFVNLNYVDKQVKGNERSIINITFSIAKETRDMELGQLVSFDRFFGPMLQGSMQHLGQRAMRNANEAINLITDSDKKEFYTRTVKVLFMLCNLAEEDKQQFPACIDNIATLLMTQIDEQKLTIKQKVEEVMDFLVEKAVIRKVKADNRPETFEFFTEEESKVAQLISNQQVDNNTYCDELKKIFFSYFGNPSNKVNYATCSFTVGISIDGRNYLTNNADVNVDFVISSAEVDVPEQYGFSIMNTPMKTHLIFFIYPLIIKNRELNTSFIDYCRVQRFIMEPAQSPERQQTKELFRNRAKETYEKEIVPKFRELLDTCAVISNGEVMSAADIGSAKGDARYTHLLEVHMARLYSSAKMVDCAETPRTRNDLSAKILRPIDPSLMQTPISIASDKIREFLDKKPHDVAVSEITDHFSKVPFGWSEIATIYYLNELVRHHLYKYNYNNQPDVSRETVAGKIVTEQNRFTVERAKAIPQQIINDFIDSWKKIFNVVALGGNDSTELFRNCNELETSALKSAIKNNRELELKLNGYKFIDKLTQSIALMQSWCDIRDHQKFFEKVTADCDTASDIFDECKKIRSFYTDQFDNFKIIEKFYEDNRDNFTFLDSSMNPTVTELEKILSDTHPWDSMPSYMKMKRELDAKLNTKRKELCDTIRQNYNDIFDDLEKYAASVNVPRDKFAARDATIIQKTASNSFYALKANADTSGFNTEQLDNIYAAIPHPVAPTPAPVPPSGKTAPATKTATAPVAPAAPVRRRRAVTLNTKRTTPICTEDDIDNYLGELKKQLMEMIKNDDIIIN